MKEPEYIEGSEALENFERFGRAILQAPKPKIKAKKAVIFCDSKSKLSTCRAGAQTPDSALTTCSCKEETWLPPLSPLR
jgi:hypothetical protein